MGWPVGEKHVVQPSSESAYTGHAWHTDKPALGPKKPDAQLAQAVNPSVPVYVPARQLSQTSDVCVSIAGFINLPAVQSVHILSPVAALY